MRLALDQASTPLAGLAARWRVIPRCLLGLLFVVSGVDGFYLLWTGAELIHPPTSPAAQAFDQALIATGYMWPLIKGVNLLGGLSLLLNVRPALGLALILPAIVVITFYHLVLNPAGVPAAIIMDALAAVLLHAYRDRYAPMVR